MWVYTIDDPEGSSPSSSAHLPFAFAPFVPFDLFPEDAVDGFMNSSTPLSPPPPPVPPPSPSSLASSRRRAEEMASRIAFLEGVTDVVLDNRHRHRHRVDVATARAPCPPPSRPKACSPGAGTGSRYDGARAPPLPPPRGAASSPPRRRLVAIGGISGGPHAPIARFRRRRRPSSSSRPRRRRVRTASPAPGGRSTSRRTPRGRSSPPPPRTRRPSVSYCSPSECRVVEVQHVVSRFPRSLPGFTSVSLIRNFVFRRSFPVLGCQHIVAPWILSIYSFVLNEQWR